ncbi:MAG: O-antigen ligase family protein, partial [Neisseriaceae bacterium]
MSLKLSKIANILILTNIIILFTIPQLNNIHYDPSPTFWAQIIFVWVSNILFLTITLTQKKINIPFITIPLLCFAIYICSQQFFVKLPFVGLNYITALEMLVCIMLSISANTIVNNYSLRILIIYLSIALLISSLLQSAIGFIQYNNLFKYFGGFIFYDPLHPTTNIFGHFGQRNHYCHFLTWATFALIYLYHIKFINKYIFLPTLCWFMFSMTIAASRSVFIYFMLGNIITFIYFLIKKDKASLSLFLTTIFALILLVSFEYFYPLMQSKIHITQVASGFNRLASGEGNEMGRRFVEWQKAFITFKQNFVFGTGLFGYAKNSVFLYKLFPHTPLNSGLFTNCHNIVLQLLAETGIIG